MHIFANNILLHPHALIPKIQPNLHVPALYLPMLTDFRKHTQVYDNFMQTHAVFKL